MRKRLGVILGLLIAVVLLAATAQAGTRTHKVTNVTLSGWSSGPDEDALLTQVVANLLQNAAEAMRDKVPSQRRTIVVTSEAAGADEVKVTVSDEGAGIPVEVREQLFTPFFSTKAEGLGLGLTICQSVIEAHGGRLWLDKEGERGGATFRFTLPTEAA